MKDHKNPKTAIEHAVLVHYGSSVVDYEGEVRAILANISPGHILHVVRINQEE